MSPDCIGKYKLTRVLGAGGMATVYEGIHEMLGSKVAVKLLNPLLSSNESIQSRFIAEAKVMAALDHPNITKIIDFSEENGHLAIIMENLVGEDLNQKVKRDGPLPPSLARKYFEQILSAFQYAHDQGVIHRDIKPSNIFILADGTIKVLDFGIAKLLDAGNELTVTGAQMGTPAYMSPEQVRSSRSIDHHSDIYALGVTLFFAVTGRPPYDVESESQFDIYNQIVHNQLPLAQVPLAYQPLIARACQKEKTDRFVSCKQWWEAMSNTEEFATNSQSSTADATIVDDAPFSGESPKGKDVPQASAHTTSNSSDHAPFGAGASKSEVDLKDSVLASYSKWLKNHVWRLVGAAFMLAVVFLNRVDLYLNWNPIIDQIGIGQWGFVWIISGFGLSSVVWTIVDYKTIASFKRTGALPFKMPLILRLLIGLSLVLSGLLFLTSGGRISLRELTMFWLPAQLYLVGLIATRTWQIHRFIQRNSDR